MGEGGGAGQHCVLGVALQPEVARNQVQMFRNDGLGQGSQFRRSESVPEDHIMRAGMGE